MTRAFWCCLCFSLFTHASFAASGPAVTDPAKAGADYVIQGEYTEDSNNVESSRALQIIALDKDEYQVVVYQKGLPGRGWSRQDKKSDSKFMLLDQKLTSDKSEQIFVVKGLNLELQSPQGETLGTFFKLARKSPTLGMQPPAGAIVLFNGKDKEEFKGGSLQPESSSSSEQVLQTNPGGSLHSKQEFTDFTLHLEFKTPYMPQARGQGRGNSGVYLQNRYEVQILDSFGLEGVDNECGGIYKASKPIVNMCLPPLQWQTYDIDFTAAKFNDQGERTTPAVVTVKHNGVTIHDQLELKNGITPGGAGKEAPGHGPLQIQDHGNPVQLKNIWVVEKSKS